jgi:di/tricarboxylate transporter
MEQGIVFITLFLVLFLFVWGKIRHDLVALLALFLLTITQVIDPATAFEGFGHPAVITVAAVLVIGKALEFSGLVDVMGKWIMKIGSNIFLQLFTICILVAVASAFMNNVGALAIMMPIAIMMARKSGRSPSLYLMPIAFSSLLGGMTTLIGTPPNIIISTFRNTYKGEAFNMFDFAPVGVVVALAGVVYIVLVGWRFLPKRDGKANGNGLFDIEDYITEVQVLEESLIKGKYLSEIKQISKAEINILGIVRNNQRIHAPRSYEKLLKDDILILETDAEELKQFVDNTKVILVGGEKLIKEAKGSSEITTVEAVVMADSNLVGRTASDLKMRWRYGINLLAVARKEQQIQRRIDHVIFRNGDVLLFQGHEDTLRETIISLGCLPLAERDIRIGYKTKIPLAIGIFGLSILLVVFNILPVPLSFSMAAVALLLFKVLPLRHFYTSIDWPVIVLLAAMIPVGGALESSGSATLIADFVVSISHNLPPWSILALIMIITMLLSDIINNAATVVLMAPISISVATTMGYSIDPFLMATAIGASSAFLTPIGHQSNTLVMGPGGYAFSDYWRMGILLEVIIVAVSIPLLMIFWPL